MRRIDITGRVFGRLTVLAPEGIDSLWRCECTCGAVVSVTGTSLRSGRARSCGCLRRELHARRFTTHGLTIGHAAGDKLPAEYTAWLNMKERVKPGAAHADRYFARGITVCRSWLDSFESFLEDMGPRPSPRHTIDRIDNNGNYEPGNCRWATWTEQANNRSPRRRRARQQENRP